MRDVADYLNKQSIFPSLLIAPPHLSLNSEIPPKSFEFTASVSHIHFIYSLQEQVLLSSRFASTKNLLTKNIHHSTTVQSHRPLHHTHTLQRPPDAALPAIPLPRPLFDFVLDYNASLNLIRHRLRLLLSSRLTLVFF